MAKPDEENSFSTTTHNQSDQTALQPQTSQKHRVFEDFSMVQVIASALSAVTSMLLSSQIGIIGGVVGVAAGAAVAAIATQIYKGLLNVSADKIKHVAAEGGVYKPFTSSQTTFVGQSSQDLSNDKTVIRTIPQEASSQQQDTRVAPQYLRERNAQERRTKRNASIVIVVGALVAVAIVAVLINSFTAGEGLGTKTNFLAPSQHTSESTTSDETTQESSTDTTDHSSDNKSSKDSEKIDKTDKNTEKDSQSADNTSSDSNTSSNDQDSDSSQGVDSSSDTTSSNTQTPDDSSSADEDATDNPSQGNSNSTTGTSNNTTTGA